MHHPVERPLLRAGGEAEPVAAPVVRNDERQATERAACESRRSAALARSTTDVTAELRRKLDEANAR
ncbi:hypothetical protein ACNPQM_21300 [Streptomyces sp. NPDC056231]|uniref:hypothetical protein n=1 Tax=Streptomyces sp. NPDC056231 TaxID=3345755 RepID=UPI003AB06CD1